MQEDRIISDDGWNLIGRNLRTIRKAKKIRQTEMVKFLKLHNVSITREALVKIKSWRQHIKLSQLREIKKYLDVSYEDILDCGSSDELNMEEIKL